MDTATTPGCADWACLARAGRDGRDRVSLTGPRAYDTNPRYPALDPVEFEKASYIRDNPGPIWRPLADPFRRAARPTVRAPPGSRVRGAKPTTPAKTPASVIGTLHREVNAVLPQPVTKERFAPQPRAGEQDPVARAHRCAHSFGLLDTTIDAISTGPVPEAFASAMLEGLEAARALRSSTDVVISGSAARVSRAGACDAT